MPIQDVVQDGSVLHLPTPYYLFRLATGTDHLHFGFFQRDDEPVGDAQERMMELNLFFRPAGALRVLDVGTGLGATARRLVREGCKVTSLSPDAPLVEYARRRSQREIESGLLELFVSTFEDFHSPHAFDWVLFQESFQYLPNPGAALRKAWDHLAPGGRLHVADQFLTRALPRDVARFHWLDGFLEEARRTGFRARSVCDVTRAALPSTRRMLAELAARSAELVARHERARPEIAGDVHDMLTCGRIELDASESGDLRYCLIALDKPPG